MEGKGRSGRGGGRERGEGEGKGGEGRSRGGNRGRIWRGGREVRWLGRSNEMEEGVEK